MEQSNKLLETRIESTNPEDLFVIRALVHDGIFVRSRVDWDRRRATLTLHLAIPEGEYVAAHEIKSFPSQLTFRCVKDLVIDDRDGVGIYDIADISYDEKARIFTLEATLGTRLLISVDYFSVEVHRIEADVNATS